MGVVDPFQNPNAEQQVSITLDVVDGVKIRAQISLVTGISSLPAMLKEIRNHVITELLDSTELDNKIIKNYNERVQRANSEEKKN